MNFLHQSIVSIEIAKRNEVDTPEDHNNSHNNDDMMTTTIINNTILRVWSIYNYDRIFIGGMYMSGSGSVQNTIQIKYQPHISQI